jgi:hypothetical protein
MRARGLLIASILLVAGEARAAAFAVEVLVPGGVMHAVEGISFDGSGMLLGTSIHGQAVYRIDPRTGVGLTDHSLVTVLAPDGVTADALSTSVSVLGPERGLKLVEDTPGTAALLVRKPGEKIGFYESARWREIPKASGSRSEPPRP